MHHHTREPHDVRTDTHTQEAPSGDVTAPPAESPGAPAPRSAEAPAAHSAPERATDTAKPLHARWREIQSDFVDDPRASVAAADALVGQSIEQLTTRLTERKRDIESAWQHADDDDTERLRTVLRDYRVLLDRVATAAQ